MTATSDAITTSADLARMARMASIVRDLSPVPLEAWLTYGERMAAGMPIAEAEALMWSELNLACDAGECEGLDVHRGRT